MTYWKWLGHKIPSITKQKFKAETMHYSVGFTHLPFKGFLECGKFIKDAAKCPDVRLLVVLAPLTDLWRDVARGPDHLRRER